LSGDQNFLVWGKELHKDDWDDSDKCAQHSPLVADSINDPTGSSKTDQLASFGDLFQDRLTGGTFRSDFFFRQFYVNSLDVVLAIGQLGTELPHELREPEQIADEAVVICFKNY
jgi:hypothetical protein